MSRELLLLAGPATEGHQRHRADQVAHAARQVPGYVAVRTAESPTAAVALVETDPAGGSHAVLQETAGHVLAAVASTALGLDVARRPPHAGASAGAEGGHLAVRLGPDGEVVVSTDGMATVPSFWFQDGDQVYLATHLASLVSLGVPARTDERGLLEYLVTLHPLGVRTLLDGVRLLPPGGHLTWHPRTGLRLTERPGFTPGGSPMSDDEAVAEHRRVWTAVVADLFDRNDGDRVAVGLSGGLDSRGVVAAAAAAGHRPTTFAYGSPRSRDTRIAAVVADRLGLPHLRLPVSDEFLLPGAGSALHRLDGAHSPVEMFELWFPGALGTFSDVVVNGAAGGQLWGDERAMGLTDVDAFTDAVWHKYAAQAAAVAPFLQPDAAAELEQEVRAGMRESVEPWLATGRADAAVFWRIANRQVRWGGMLGTALRRSGLRSEMPYLDGRFLRYAARLTPRQRRNGALHLRVQREVFALTAGIPRNDDGNAPAHLNHVYWSADSPYALQLARLGLRHPVAGSRRVLRRATQVGLHALRDRGRLTHAADRWDQATAVFPLDVWCSTRPAFAERLAGLLREATGSHSILDDAALAAAAEALAAGRPHASAVAMGKAATAGAWINDFARRHVAAARPAAGVGRAAR